MCVFVFVVNKAVLHAPSIPVALVHLSNRTDWSFGGSETHGVCACVHACVCVCVCVCVCACVCMCVNIFMYQFVEEGETANNLCINNSLCVCHVIPIINTRSTDIMCMSDKIGYFTSRTGE